MMYINVVKTHLPVTDKSGKYEIKGLRRAITRWLSFTKNSGAGTEDHGCAQGFEDVDQSFKPPASSEFAGVDSE